MTTDEFIEAVNAVHIDNIHNRKGLEAYEEENGDIFLQTFDEVPIAVLMKYETGYETDWDFLAPSQITIPTKILKLMVDLDESMEDEYKYVILDGKSFLYEGNLSTRLFLINEDNINPSLVTIIASLDELAEFAYTKEELDQLKTTLPKKLQDAVDLLTITVNEAKKVLKNDK